MTFKIDFYYQILTSVISIAKLSLHNLIVKSKIRYNTMQFIALALVKILQNVIIGNSEFENKFFGHTVAFQSTRIVLSDSVRYCRMFGMFGVNLDFYCLKSG